jgi:hypothetical protein
MSQICRALARLETKQAEEQLIFDLSVDRGARCLIYTIPL